MTKVRKQLVIDKEVSEVAKKRMKEINRKSFNNYVETLIIEDCKNVK